MNMTITIFKDLLLKKDYKTIQNILNVMNAVDIALSAFRIRGQGTGHCIPADSKTNSTDISYSGETLVT